MFFLPIQELKFLAALFACFTRPVACGDSRRKVLWLRRCDPKSKPRQREVDAAKHGQQRNHPQKSKPNPSGPKLWQESGDQAERERCNRRRGGPAVPVHCGRKEAERRVGDVARLDHSGQNNAERRKNGEQRKFSRERDHIAGSRKPSPNAKAKLRNERAAVMNRTP